MKSENDVGPRTDPCGVASIDSDELSSFCEVVLYPQPNVSSDSKVV